LTENFKVFEKSDITLVLSGDIQNPESKTLLSFWCTFIKLQASLPANKPVSQIVAHSWDSDQSNLVQIVYSPREMSFEHDETFCTIFSEYKSSGGELQLRDKCEQGIWKDETLLLVLYKAYSRARAVRLIDRLPSKKGQVLITYFELGLSNITQSNQIVADASLPEDYLYLSYSPDVDFGYPDDWMVASWEIAQYFASFDQHVFHALNGQNDYLELFTKIGWPIARSKSRYEGFLLNLVEQKLLKSISKNIRNAFNNLEGNIEGDNFFRKIVRRTLRPIHLALSKPILTGENSFIANPKYFQVTFGKYLALNIRSLLKHFIFFSGLRDRVRFLTEGDFEINAQSGQLINPQRVILILYEGQESVLHLLEQSPLPLAAVYQISNGLVHKYLPNGQGGWTSATLQSTRQAFKDQILYLLTEAGSLLDKSIPVLLMQNVKQYLACEDWFYLNALMKYVVWSNSDYVALDYALRGKTYLEFPNLDIVQSKAFPLSPCVGTMDGIQTLFNATMSHPMTNFEGESKTSFVFPVVSSKTSLFKKYNSDNN
jgi:hypothetical protein